MAFWCLGEDALKWRFLEIVSHWERRSSRTKTGMLTNQTFIFPPSVPRYWARHVSAKLGTTLGAHWDVNLKFTRGSISVPSQEAMCHKCICINLLHLFEHPFQPIVPLFIPAVCHTWCFWSIKDARCLLATARIFATRVERDAMKFQNLHQIPGASTFRPWTRAGEWKNRE